MAKNFEQMFAMFGREIQDEFEILEHHIDCLEQENRKLKQKNITLAATLRRLADELDDKEY